MANSPAGLDDLWASAVVDNDAAGLTKTRGCRVVNNANVYEFTLDRELDEYDCAVSIMIRGNDGLTAFFTQVEHTSDALKKIRFRYTSGGGVQPASFSVQFRRIANGNQ